MPEIAEPDLGQSESLENRAVPGLRVPRRAKGAIVAGHPGRSGWTLCQKRLEGSRLGVYWMAARTPKWLVEADFTLGFEGTSLGRRPAKNSGEDKAALCAGFVPIPVWGAVGSVIGVR